MKSLHFRAGHLLSDVLACRIALQNRGSPSPTSEGQTGMWDGEEVFLCIVIAERDGFQEKERLGVRSVRCVGLIGANFFSTKTTSRKRSQQMTFAPPRSRSSGNGAGHQKLRNGTHSPTTFSSLLSETANFHRRDGGRERCAISFFDCFLNNWFREKTTTIRKHFGEHREVSVSLQMCAGGRAVGDGELT